MASTSTIEVYEWKEGAPRPGTAEKPRDTCMDILAVPPDGQLPQTGDIMILNEPGTMKPVRYRVIERELMWTRGEKDDSQTGAKWGKMWISVRRLADETK